MKNFVTVPSVINKMISKYVSKDDDRPFTSIHSLSVNLNNYGYHDANNSASDIYEIVTPLPSSDYNKEKTNSKETESKTTVFKQQDFDNVIRNGSISSSTDSISGKSLNWQNLETDSGVVDEPIYTEMLPQPNIVHGGKVLVSTAKHITSILKNDNVVRDSLHFMRNSSSEYRKNCQRIGLINKQIQKKRFHSSTPASIYSKSGIISDAKSSGEAANLQTRLRHLSTELVCLRKRLHNEPVEDRGENTGSSQVISSKPVFTNNSNLGYINSSVFTTNQLGQTAFKNNGNIKSNSTCCVDQVEQINHLSNSLEKLENMQIHHNYSNIAMLPPPKPAATSTAAMSMPLPCLPDTSVPSVAATGSCSVTSSNGGKGHACFNGKPELGLLKSLKVQPQNGGADSSVALISMKKKDEEVSGNEKLSNNLAELDDLIHLRWPLTEDVILRTMQARFLKQKYFTSIGPIVLSVNSFGDVGNPLTLASIESATSVCTQLQKTVKEALRLQAESGYPQAVIVSGSSGSGKTYTTMILLRHLFDAAGGGQETDAFKHLSAAFSVLRSLGSATTASNKESSRIGNFIEVQVSDGAIYRTKIHCYFLDQSRVVNPLPMERNFHIFYQMLAGLSNEERQQLGLDGFGVRDLAYLNAGDLRLDEALEAERFAVWKTNLSILGIPFLDVVRILAAILLLGNLEFREGDGLDVNVIGREALEAVAILLGISSSVLLHGLTTRTYNVRGQLVESMSDANMSNSTRDSLAKSLYCRTVATIVRRANSLKRPIGALSGTTSSDSNDSVHHEIASHHASTVGTSSTRHSSKSMAILSSAVRHATDGFIGILDMFGFEDSRPSQMEQLCINLCSETMQHFYNTHIFKSSIESCRDEGILTDLNVDYIDNVPVIDLISSLRTGLLSMLDVECSVRGCPETYVQKVKVQHKENKKIFEPKHCDTNRTFAIHHYAGPVVYDATGFMDTNRDIIPDDIVSIFHKDICSFGFATHLFGNEVRALYSSNKQVPRGISFRISPTSHHPELLNGDEPVSTLTQDFHTRLDNLLRTLVHAKPHFIRCLRPNDSGLPHDFDRTTMIQQIRSLQILETVHLMSEGFPHRVRFKAFNSRYRILIRSTKKSLSEPAEDCSEILRHCCDSFRSNKKEWAIGRKHVFLSETMRQYLESRRDSMRQLAATIIQCNLRGYFVRKNRPRKENSSTKKTEFKDRCQRPRPQPISGTPPPDTMQNDRCDFNIIQQTCSLFGLDLERPPPVPPSRSYTVSGNKKVCYPQTRIMKANFPDGLPSGDSLLQKGELVLVTRASQHRGHLVVEKQNKLLHVPHPFLEMKQPLVGFGV